MLVVLVVVEVVVVEVVELQRRLRSSLETYGSGVTQSLAFVRMVNSGVGVEFMFGTRCHPITAARSPYTSATSSSSTAARLGTIGIVVSGSTTGIRGDVCETWQLTRALHLQFQLGYSRGELKGWLIGSADRLRIIVEI